MLRRLRVASGGYAFHVLNRAVGRMRIFRKERDFEALEEVIEQAKARLPMRGLAWQERTAKRPGLQSTLRPRGRPLKSPPAEGTRS